MKHIKRLFSTLLVLALALTFAIPAFAADITVKNAVKGNTYTAYKLFNATEYEAKEGEDGPTFAYTFPDDDTKAVVIAAVKETAKKYTVDGVDVTEATDANDVLPYLEGLKDNAEAMNFFAKEIYSRKDSLPKPPEKAKITAEGDTVKFTGLDNGYYFITETIVGTDDVESMAMLDTAAKNTAGEVTLKKDAPTSDKKVQEKNDSESAAEGTNPTGWQDGADYDIGDHVPFKITGTLKDDISTYETYKVTFHDRMDPGLTLDGDSVKVYIDESAEKKSTAPIGNDLYTLDAPAADGHAFDVIFTDLTGAEYEALNLTKETVIRIEFTATLNEKAVIGSKGNWNHSQMEFPKSHYNDETSKTPEDEVVVYTYEVDVHKVAADETTPLEGADFTLYKWVAGAEEDPEDENTKGDGTGAWVEWHANNGKTLKSTNDNKTAPGEATEFYFKGLDDGKYKLVETVVPQGYNKADDIEFTITAEYADDLDAEDAKEFKVSSSKPEDEFIPTDGKFVTTIANMTGAELPSTGGMGTTLFYIVGGILVAAAVILLVTKKRVNSDK